MNLWKLLTCSKPTAKFADITNEQTAANQQGRITQNTTSTDRQIHYTYEDNSSKELQRRVNWQTKQTPMSRRGYD